MNKWIFFFLIMVVCQNLSSQTRDYMQTKEWLDQHNIELNQPKGIEGFDHFVDCDSNHSFRKIVGDTIILYSKGGSAPKSLSEFKELILHQSYNVTRYPSLIQKNGTILMTNLDKLVFIWRNDTLYLWDDTNYEKQEDFMVLQKRYSTQEINFTEFKTRVEDLEHKEYNNYSPRFKVIYFKGIFINNVTYTFSQELNFKKETVKLINAGEVIDQQIYVIKLESNKNYYFTLIESNGQMLIQKCKGGY